ncbi:MAG: acetate--CoA ligase family protein [Nitrospinales bacterium]
MNETATMKVEGNKVSSSNLLEPFFAPKEVAVIGASPSHGNLGKRIVESLYSHGYQGRITTVHPRGLSLPNTDTVKNINDLTETTDLAIASVSANHILELIEPLANKGIKSLIVIGGGFAETGDEGKKRQDKLKELSKKWGVRIIGPNCLGTFSAKNNFNSFFLSANKIQLPKSGSIGIISQSGAFLSSMLDQLARRNLGVHRAINFGNRIDIGECEVLEAFAADPAIKVIGIYLESIQNGTRLLELVRSIGQTKPIIICKGGKTERGSLAVQSHSASLSGSYTVFQTACEQLGLIEVQGLAELINALYVFSVANIRKGNRVLIVSNGGGMGVMLADLCEQGGCVVNEPPIEIQQELQKFLPLYYSLKNPIDITGSGTNEECIQAVSQLLQTGLYDCLLLIILSGTEGINADIITQLRKSLPNGFPVVLGAYGNEMFQNLIDSLQGTDIPVFSSGEDAAWAVKIQKLHETSKSIPKIFPSDLSSNYSFTPLKGWLDQIHEAPDEMKLKLKLSECDVQIPRSFEAGKTQELSKAVSDIGFPLILKVAGKDIKHKAEINGMRLDIFSESDLNREWNEMNRVWPGQVWVEEQMPPGLDLIVGMHRDVDFGPVLLFGTGGKYVKLYRDIERVILPASNEEILQAILRTKASKIIQGFRGDDKLALQKLIEFISLIVKWVDEDSKLLSLDFNPIRLYSNSLVVLDAKATISTIS